MADKVVRVSFGDASGQDCYIFNYAFTRVDPQDLLESKDPDDQTRLAIAMLYKEAQKANSDTPITSPVLFNEHSANRLSLAPVSSSNIAYVGLNNDLYSGQKDIKHVSVEVDIETMQAFLEAGNRRLIDGVTLKSRGLAELEAMCPSLKSGTSGVSKEPPANDTADQLDLNGGMK